MNKALKQSLESIGDKARFVSFTYQVKSSGDLSRFTLLLGANYRKLLENSLLAVQLERVENAMASTGLPRQICRNAKAFVLKSRRESIRKGKQGQYNKAYTKKHVYVTSGIPSVKIHVKDLSLEVTGIEIQRKTLVKGNKPKPKRRESTIAKNYFRKLEAIGAYKTLCIENIESARLEGETLVID